MIEVLIAAVLVIVVMYWLTQYYVMGRKHLDYEEHRRKATAVAQARLDQVRDWPYDYLASLVDSVTVDTTMVVDGRSYDVSLTFSPGPNPHATKVQAVVMWQAGLPYEPGNAFTRRDTTTTLVGRRFGS